MKKTRIFHGFLAAAAAVSLILILLLSAFEMAAYGDFGFYEKEYEKYEIQNTLPMEMDDIMDVTKKMMAYLKGDREELSVMTIIGGERQDFFNEQDRFHMGEVRDLFLAGFALRKIAVVVLVISVAILFFLKADWKRILPKAYDNDLWMFDPASDYMIRMLTEGFFFDITLRIGGFFVAFLLFFEILCLGIRIWRKRKGIRTAYK